MAKNKTENKVKITPNDSASSGKTLPEGKGRNLVLSIIESIS